MRESAFDKKKKKPRLKFNPGFEQLGPGRLLNFWTLRGWALIKFSTFSASEVCLFCNKTINAINKTRRSNKARFL